VTPRSSLKPGNFDASVTIISSIAGLRHNSRAHNKAINRNGEHQPFAAEKLGGSNRQVWQGVELWTKSGLVHRRDSRRHQHFAAELAGEISLSFEQRHGNFAAGEHVGEEGARRSTADDGLRLTF